MSNLMIFEPRLRLLSVFVLTYTTLGMGYAVLSGNMEFVFYCAVIVLLIGLVLFMDRRVHFSTLVLWCFGVWGALHIGGGIIPIPESVTEPGDNASVLYNLRLQPWMPKYDQLVHAFGFGTCTIAAYESISAHVGKKLPMDIVMASIVVLIAMGLGAVNELVEFLAVLIFPNTNVGGYINTGWDLVSNGTGCLIAAAYLKFLRG